MKILVALGVALLCISQVRGSEGDKLLALFEEKTKQLNGTELAVATTPAPYACDAKTVMANGNQLIKNTLDIVAKTFSVVYTARYPESGNKDCTLGTFRCFLQEFTDTKDAIVSVKSMLMSYKGDASDLATKIKEYFANCL